MWTKSFVLAAAFVVSQTAFCETRWCSITGRQEAGMIVYPPIARAAHIEGTVIGRLQFSTDGKVQNFESVSGPIMLTRVVSDRVKSWIVKTDAKGSELCQSLFVVNFEIGSATSGEPFHPNNYPGIFEMSIRVEPVVLYSLPSVASTR